MIKLGVVLTTLIMCKQVNSDVTQEKILETNVFSEYILMNQGATRYHFTYKPILLTSTQHELENEQFLVVDFSNFEIKDSLPYLPQLTVSYTDKD